jgi:SulP family sulfate permease
VLLVSTIGLLLNAGGLVGYHAISLSSLNHTLGDGRRVPGLVTALLLGATACVGVGALGAMPTLLLGALLVYLGLGLLHEWVYRAWFTCSRIEWLIVVLVMGIIAARGFLAGIAVGLALAVVVFVVSASRTSVVKHALSGVEYRSRVTRDPGQQAIPRARGGELYVLKLQGVIFFGTANALYERIRARTRDPGSPTLRFVVLDFAQVRGLDSTGLLSFAKMYQLARAQRLTLVLTGLSGGVGAQFARGGFGAQPGVLRIFADLDHGLEWCESEIIAAQAAPGQAQRQRAQPEAIVPAGTEQVGRGSDTHLDADVRREICAHRSCCRGWLASVRSSRIVHGQGDLRQ